MALPMLFTACSQDELLDNVAVNNNLPEAKGYYMSLNPSLGDVESRAQWLDANHKLQWVSTDKISVFWLNDQETTGAGTAGTLKGFYNSVFKTDEAGQEFTSESMVFEGGNVAVYPADMNFYKQGDIVLRVPTSQDASVIENVPYISNYVKVQDNENLSEQIPGYNKGLKMPMKMAANVLELDINLANTENLAIYNFTVDSVSLVAKNSTAAVNAFAATANLKVNGTPENTYELKYKDANNVEQKVKTITKQIQTVGNATTSVLTTKAITDLGGGKFHVKFVILPTDNTTLDKNSEIVIYTNCGRINLTTETKTGTAAAQLLETYPTTELAEGQVITGAVTNYDGKMQTISELLEQVLANRTMEATATSDFNGEKVGRPYVKSIDADMANATLNDSPVKNSEQIINYVAIYKAMNCQENMNLILTADEGSTFKSLSAEAIKAMDSLNKYNVANGVKATLSMGEGMTDVQLADGGNVYFNDDKMWKNVANNTLNMVLAADKTWTMDDNYSFNKVGNIINNGTLTIKGTTDNNGKQRKLVEKVENNGTLNIGGNNILFVNGKFATNEKSTVNVKANQIFTFAENIYNGLNGTFEVAVDGQLTSAAGVKVVTDATINNAGIVAAEGIVEGFFNNGIINVTDDAAITYLQSNANGEIILKNRNDEVKIYNEALKGKIVYNYNVAKDKATFKLFNTDRFTYVKFGSDASTITLNNTSGTGVITDYSAISMEFLGTTTLEPNAKTIADFTVAKNAHVKVLSERELTVKNFYLYGQLTIGGAIEYAQTYVNEGRILNPGTGTINKMGGANFEEISGTYYINNLAGLLEFAEKAKTSSFEGKTVELTANISLAGIEWNPIGSEGKLFRGTFNGNGYTISDLNVKRSEDAGLFGYVAGTIDNVKIENAFVIGNKNVAALVGRIYGTVNNCEVTNSTIIAEILNGELDGDNVAAIAGFCGEGTMVITNNNVENCVIISNPAKDAAVVAGSVFTANSTLSGNTSENVTINGTASTKVANMK